MLPIPIRSGRAAQLSPTGIPSNLDRLFSWPPFSSEERGPLTGQYPVDVYEVDDSIAVDAEMPGFKPEEIDVTLDRGVLSICAERKAEETGGPRHLSERRFTRVERSFSLPADVDPSSAMAKLEDGVLHLELPKTEESQSRRSRSCDSVPPLARARQRPSAPRGRAAGPGRRPWDATAPEVERNAGHQRRRGLRAAVPDPVATLWSNL